MIFPKKILIIGSRPEDHKAILEIFDLLDKNKFPLCFLWRNPGALKKNHRAGQSFFASDLANNFKIIFFIGALPLLLLLNLKKIISYKLRQKIKIIVCLNWQEKMIFTPLARFCRLKVLWLECPALNCQRINRFLRPLYKFNSRWARLLAFNSLTKIRLGNEKIKEEKITLIQPGIKINGFYQKNIFTELAETEHADFRHKFFTIGAVFSEENENNLENLFQAVKKALEAAQGFQLIVISDGEERKRLVWLAKKMKLESLVWLVGDRENLKKWLNSFNLFVITTARPKLEDLITALKVMAASRPIIAPLNEGWEDLIENEKNGLLLDLRQSEPLARQLIKLSQDKRWRARLGEQGRQTVEKYFIADKMVEKIEEEINSLF